jgi:hypothetical protein
MSPIPHLTGLEEQFVNANLEKKDVAYDTCSLEPDRRLDERSYQFKGTLKAPKRVGNYQIRVLATGFAIIEADSKEAKAEQKAFGFFSPRIEIQVTK